MRYEIVEWAALKGRKVEVFISRENFNEFKKTFDDERVTGVLQPIKVRKL